MNLPTNTHSTEVAIIVRLCEQLHAAGYAPCAVYDGEEYQTAAGELVNFEIATQDPLSTDAVIEYATAVEDCTIHFRRIGKLTWGHTGVFLVFGNSPSELISDYHCGDKDFAAVVDSVSKWADDQVQS